MSRVTIVLLGLSLTLSGQAAAQDKATNAACKLVSGAELSKITVQPFSDGTPVGTDGATSQCGWDRPKGGGLQVTLYLANAKAAFDQFAAFPGHKAVAGVGDAAGWNEMMHHFVVRKGERALVFKFNFAGGDQAGWGKQLATLALGRL